MISRKEGKVEEGRDLNDALGLGVRVIEISVIPSKATMVNFVKTCRVRW